MAFKKKSVTSKVKSKNVRSLRVAPKKKPPVKIKATKKPAGKAAKAPRKITLKKAAARRALPKQDVIGRISHYFPHVMAGVVKVKKPLLAGELVQIKGHTTDFVQKVVSMQIDRTPIQTARVGDEIGIKVESRVRRGDLLIRVKP